MMVSRINNATDVILESRAPAESDTMLAIMWALGTPSGPLTAIPQTIAATIN